MRQTFLKLSLAAIISLIMPAVMSAAEPKYNDKAVMEIINGNPKTVTEIFPGNLFVSEFSRDGRLVKYQGFEINPENVERDKENRITKVSDPVIGNVIDEHTYNDDGTIQSYIYLKDTYTCRYNDRKHCIEILLNGKPYINQTYTDTDIDYMGNWIKRTYIMDDGTEETEERIIEYWE